MKRVAEVISDLLADGGVRHVFTVTGGAAMHLNDAFGRQPRLSTFYCHHEQACAMAAESYTRLSGRLAAVNVTAGPGALNALNGVFGAFVDSVGMIVVSGQAKRETMVTSYDLPLRQLGDQEVDIVSVAEKITKHIEVLRDPLETRVVVERALWIASHGRPGPVWIDVPIDVQSALVEPTELLAFDVENDEAARSAIHASDENLLHDLHLLLDGLARARRPVLIAGTGIRTSGAYEDFLATLEKLQIPVTTAFNAHDLLWDDHPLYVGRPGTVGDRAGNFAVQNADFVLILGCRMNIRQISYNWNSFARGAVVSMIDIDASELKKPTLRIDLPILAHLGDALHLLAQELPYSTQPHHREYLDWCRQKRLRYPVSGEHSAADTESIDPYTFLDGLFDELDDSDVIVTGDGTACVATFQVARIRRGQRLYSNSGAASMGYDLPAAIGAAVALESGRVICIAGDGSIMMNLQELQTIAGHDLPIKIIVLNNDGYSSIRQTQSNFFPDNIVGCDPSSGLTFPEFAEVASAFGITSHRCDSADTQKKAIRALLDGSGPALLEVVVNRDQPFAPKLSSRQLPDGTMVSSPLEDMAPFLPRTELAENMIVPMILDE
jgi:acetolactate synthase I/II/III large subunit